MADKRAINSSPTMTDFTYSDIVNSNSSSTLSLSPNSIH